MRWPAVLVVSVALVGCGSSAHRGAGRDAGSDGGAGGSAGADAGGASGSSGSGGVSDAGSDASDASDAGSAFGASVVISDPANASFVPCIAARAGGAIVAFHDFAEAGSRIVYSMVKNGMPGSLMELSAATLSGPKRPWVAQTPSGYVLAYQASDGTSDVVRAVELDADGAVTSGPVTISTPGSEAAMPRVATNSSGEEAFSWTDGSAHYVALRGPGENLAATAVGTTLLSGGLLNFPRIALDDSGRLFLAYRDGGATSGEWDVLLVVRPANGSFSAPVNVSNSPGLLSDDISLAMEPTGALDIAWVDQDPQDVNAFDVDYARREPGGNLSPVLTYGKQGLWTWAPIVVPGAISAWATGPQAFGPMYLGVPLAAPAPLLPGETGGQVALARDPTSGALHFAYEDTATPRQIHYAYAP